MVTDHWSVSGITKIRSDILRVGVPPISLHRTTPTNPQMKLDRRL